MSLEQMLKERNLPSLLNGVTTKEAWEERKKDILQILKDTAYGPIPPEPDTMAVVEENVETNLCSGHATIRHLRAEFTWNEKNFSFPFFEAIPNNIAEKIPAFVYIRFYHETTDKYLPLEEIIDNGFAMFSFCYKEATSDDNDFTTGIAPFIGKDRDKDPDAPGKISMWAWCAMRVMDYVLTKKEIDPQKIGVVGHSRLGKTALWTGANDPRFPFVISNDSGCMGASIGRGKIGETNESIAQVFPFWFCPKYNEMALAKQDLPFDQHFLMSLSVPRRVCVASAEEDFWADPTSEFLGLYAINEVYRLYGKKGLVCKDEIPTPTAILNEGDAVYHFRTGCHFIGRFDWNVYMDTIRKAK